MDVNMQATRHCHGDVRLRQHRLVILLVIPRPQNGRRRKPERRFSGEKQAEGRGLEPPTPCGAPDFESDDDGETGSEHPSNSKK